MRAGRGLRRGTFGVLAVLILVGSGVLPPFITSMAYQRSPYSPEVPDTAVRDWAQTYYEVADFKVFPANSTMEV